jgi:hypothetical protein
MLDHDLPGTGKPQVFSKRVPGAHIREAALNAGSPAQPD